MSTLPPVDLKISARTEHRGKEDITRVTIENPGKSLAFFVHLKVNQADGEEILPVIWEDNYFSLLPGEKRELRRRPMPPTTHRRPPDPLSSFRAGMCGRKPSRETDKGEPPMNIATLIVLAVLGQQGRP